MTRHHRVRDKRWEILIDCNAFQTNVSHSFFRFNHIYTEKEYHTTKTAKLKLKNGKIPRKTNDFGGKDLSLFENFMTRH